MSQNEIRSSDNKEEEIIVFADFKNNIIINELKSSTPFIKIIGLESESPFAEINGNLFKGKYDFSMGTHVIFEEDDNSAPLDPIYEKYSKRTFKYLKKSNKVLNFSRIFVEPQNNSSQTIQDATNKQNEKNPLQVDKIYEDALKQLNNKSV